MNKHACCSFLILALFTLALTACRGITGDSGPTSAPAQVNSFQTSVNHILFMMQENRSFDHYFGHLGAYREKNGYGPASDIDGTPADAVNTSTDNTPLHPFHLDTTCIEPVSGDWLESHLGMNVQHPGSSDMPMNGFVDSAAEYSQANGLDDKAGARVMGYYDERDLPFYYFMAANFATSDRWFSPLPSTSIPNRIFVQAGTTAGHVHEPITDGGACCDQIPTIYHLLDKAGISWKIYYSDLQSNGQPLTDINNYWPQFAAQHKNNIVPISEYYKDLTNQTLPAFAFIQAGLGSGRDEHPGGQQQADQGGNDIELGARYTADIINAFMGSYAWKDSVFVLTFDESGAFYDHVAPQPATPPDDIKPVDLQPKDAQINPQGDFNLTGFRMPLIVISPFTKKSYVSHTVADTTAVLKMVETRFGLNPLTKRDAAQPDMLEFFDFTAKPWATPPTPPPQAFTGSCAPANVPQFGVKVP